MNPRILSVLPILTIILSLSPVQSGTLKDAYDIARDLYELGIDAQDKSTRPSYLHVSFMLRGFYDRIETPNGVIVAPGNGLWAVVLVHLWNNDNQAVPVMKDGFQLRLTLLGKDGKRTGRMIVYQPLRGSLTERKNALSAQWIPPDQSTEGELYFAVDPRYKGTRSNFKNSCWSGFYHVSERTYVKSFGSTVCYPNEWVDIR